jgi:hypothetical protein
MLCNGSYELFCRVYLEILFVLPMGHPGMIDDCVSLLIIFQLFKGEGVSDNVLRQGFSSFFIIPCNPYPVVHTEAGMSPLQEFINEHITRLRCNSLRSMAKPEYCILLIQNMMI